MIRNSWKDKGISDDLLKSFWRRLWALETPETIKVGCGFLATRWYRYVSGWVPMVVSLTISYVDTLWNQSLIVSGTVQSRLAFGLVTRSLRIVAACGVGMLCGVPYRV